MLFSDPNFHSSGQNALWKWLFYYFSSHVTISNRKLQNLQCITNNSVRTSTQNCTRSAQNPLTNSKHTKRHAPEEKKGQIFKSGSEKHSSSMLRSTDRQKKRNQFRMCSYVIGKQLRIRRTQKLSDSSPPSSRQVYHITVPEIAEDRFLKRFSTIHSKTGKTAKAAGFTIAVCTESGTATPPTGTFGCARSRGSQR